MKGLVIVKLGGGLIAPKDWEMGRADEGLIEKLASEIRESGKRVVVISGSGNFGHAAVKKYGIDTAMGVSRVQRIAQKIGEIVTQKLIDVEQPGVLVAPHDIWPEGKFVMRDGMVPVFYGDVVWEEGKAVIYSGELCIEKLLPVVGRVERIVQAGCEDGVWDEDKRIIPEINEKNWDEMKRSVSGSAGVDYTGGMLHKVVKSLEFAKKFGIKTMILNGKVEGRLKEAIGGKSVFGTVVG